MSQWNFIAQRAITNEFLDWDLPLELGGLEWELSGPGSLTASLSPDVGRLRGSDGRLILEEWGTYIYAEKDDEIRWGGIVVSSAFNGDKWDIEVAGFATYPHSRIYRGEYNRIEVDPVKVITDLWGHIQSFPDSNLGVTVVGDPTPLRLGRLSYATDENGRVLDLAIPHLKWAELFDIQWLGGPVHKVHVSDSLWSWLINKGFNRIPDDNLGAVIVPPSTWYEEFPWWEAELLTLGWVGGPVRRQDVRDVLWEYLTSHGWLGKDDGTDYVIYPPTVEKDEWAYPDNAFLELAARGWVGGAVRRRDVPAEVWARLLELGFTGTADVINPPTDYSKVPGLQSWEVSLYERGWIGGQVRKQDVTELQYEYLATHGWRRKAGDKVEQLYGPRMTPRSLDENDKVYDAEPYEFYWYEAPNCGDEIDALIKSSPMDYVERHRWDVGKENVVHEIQLAYPRIGRRRDDLAFVQGDNITQVVPVESNGEEFANSIIGLGAGEGRAMLQRDASLRDGRLVRDHVVTDKAVNSTDQLDALVNDELNARRAALRITSIDVVDHPNAPLGSWQLGDDIMVRALVPWLGEVEVWCRVVSWTLTGDTTATLSLVRSDLYSYGG